MVRHQSSIVKIRRIALAFVGALVMVAALAPGAAFAASATTDYQTSMDAVTMQSGPYYRGQRDNYRSNRYAKPRYEAPKYNYAPQYKQRYEKPSYQYKSNVHHIRRGETLSGIAKRYGVSVHALAQHNNIRNVNRIYAGQKLYIPSSGYSHYRR